MPPVTLSPPPAPRTSPPVLWYTWAFGKDDYHTEAMAMLSSAMARKSPRSRFRVYTDKPEWYAWMEPLAEVRELGVAQCREWDAGYTNIFRIRAKLMEAASSDFMGHTVWLDTDMWTVKPLDELERMLDDGFCLMHRREHAIRNGPSWAKTYGKYFEGLKQFDPGTMNEWNAGVIGLPAGTAHLITEALEILDGMSSKGVSCFTRDQMALSASLEKTGKLRPTEEWFLHYLGATRRKLWMPVLKRFLFKMAVHRHEPEALLEWIRTLPPETFPPAKQPWLERKKRSLRKCLGILSPLEK